MRRVTLGGVFALSFLFCLAIYTNISVSLTPQDKLVFHELGITPLKPNHHFADEIETVKSVQKKLLSIAPFSIQKGIPDRQEREPIDLLKLRHGLCYDRSRSIDKALQYVGLPTRHVFILYRQNEPFLLTLARPGTASHAVTEVKTSRGWMLVDSNSHWISMTRDSSAVRADQIYLRKDEFDEIPESMTTPYYVIRGLYSRTGLKYPPYIYFPDIAWGDFVSALMEDDQQSR